MNVSLPMCPLVNPSLSLSSPAVAYSLSSKWDVRMIDGVFLFALVLLLIHAVLTHIAKETELEAKRKARHDKDMKKWDRFLKEREAAAATTTTTTITTAKTESVTLPSPSSLIRTKEKVPSTLPPYSSSLHGESAVHIAFLESTIVRGSVDQGIGMKDVAALDDAKCVLRDAMLVPLLVPSLFRGNLVRPPRGLLLHGPPGNGEG
jgi:SpoVK/Ycf46/Vps4 family AAA+-type ATPase